MECRLSKLPVELQLMILKSVEHPKSLISLIEASPTASSLFDECYVDIAKGVLSHSLHPQLLQLAFAMLNKRTRGFESMRSLVKSLDKGAREPQGPHAFPLEVGGHSRQGAIDLLETAATIQHEAWIVATQLLALTNELTYWRSESKLAFGKHFRNADDAQQWREETYWYGARRGPVPATEYTPETCGTPSWSEAYRIHRALWRLKLYDEHADIVRDERNPFFMASRRQSVSETVSVTKFWRHLADHELDELHSIVYACRSTPQGHLPKIWGSAESASGADQPGAPDDIPQDLFTAYPPPGGAVPHWCEIHHHFSDAVETVEMKTRGWDFITSWGSSNRLSLLADTDRQPFKRAGLPMWDKDRLFGLQLLASSADGKSSRKRKAKDGPHTAYTWKMLAFKNFYFRPPPI